MVAVTISPLVRQQFNQNGSPLANGLLFTYAAGTTNKLATYTDSSGSTPNQNPIPLDANGQADVWLQTGASYKFVLSPSTDTDPPTNPFWTRDNVLAGLGAASITINGNSLQTQFQSFVNTVVTSISALRAISKSNYNFAFVTGYYASHDGGGGAYQYDASDTTSNDNGGSIIVASDGGRWKLMTTTSVSVKQFGAKGDGVTDDTAAIQACINAKFRKIYFPQATYLITNALNCTNLAQTGVPLHLFGDAIQHDHGTTDAGTIILCRTAGANSGWIADFTGSQFCTIEDMMFLASGTNQSNKGFLFARSTLANFAQNNCLRRVMILLPSVIGASSVGSIGIANNCAEEFVMDECWIQADTPLLSTLANEISLTSPFATISNTTFSNTKYSVRSTTFQPILFSGVIAYGLAAANFDNCTIVPQTAFTYPHAITLRSSAQGYQICANIKFTGDVESFGSVLRMEGNTENIEVAVNTSNVNNGGQSHVSVVSGTSHQNFRYRPTPLNNANVNMMIGTGTTTFYGGELVLPTTMTLIDTNMVLAGTSIDGGNNDMSSTSIFNVNPASSYRPRWVNDYTHFSATINPGGITTAGSVTGTFTATGVRLTDKVSFAAPYDLQGTTVTCSVSAANQIRWAVANLTGGTITLASGTWRFWVERPTF